MPDPLRACYVPLDRPGLHRGRVFESTRLSAAEWYPDGQHGGVVSALLAHAADALPSLVPMEIARITVELFRVVRVTRLEVVARIVREGKRIQTSEVLLYDGDLEVARALVQRLRRTELGLPDDLHDRTRPPGPEGLDDMRFSDIAPFPDTGLVTFGRQVATIREATGSFREPGPATVWFRFDVELVEGQELRPIERAILAGDFSNGLSRLADGIDWVFMNSDLSVHIVRPPDGEWIAIEGASLWHDGGRGMASSLPYDHHGPVGRAVQTLFLDEGQGG